MKLHILQHVHFEGPGHILRWAENHDIEVSYTRLYEDNFSFPDLALFDILIIMGGPMSVNDKLLLPWINDEMAFIKHCMDTNKPMLGICLGAQLIAAVLGADVVSAKNKEIGWYEVKNAVLSEKWPWKLFNDSQLVFHWHGEQFEIPENAYGTLASVANSNQGFIFRSNVIGLQFHLEATVDSIEHLLTYASEDLTDNTFVQTKEEIRSLTPDNVLRSNIILEQILDRLIS
ncbi:amidotransferase [Flavobacterium sp. Sd200]|uniref:type 1 glutamine amidotransferase n=1 Tax=Flavobacterium sp. Sd200 TaxID=2692211 RepID=UPI00137137C5|nr:type 1 glutamine amidotransferase [Flavobacterium sp. Sd200]MXN90470.1 amidotransferase [Flavobacterium sp. Sd200]